MNQYIVDDAIYIGKEELRDYWKQTIEFPDLSELLPSLIISRVFPPISSTALPVAYSAKRADWVTVFANILGMLKSTIKTHTQIKNTWWFVAFLSI